MKHAIGVVTVNLCGNASCSSFRVQRVLQAHIGTISLSHDCISSVSDNEGKYSSSFPAAQQPSSKKAGKMMASSSSTKTGAETFWDIPKSSRKVTSWAKRCLLLLYDFLV